MYCTWLVRTSGFSHAGDACEHSDAPEPLTKGRSQCLIPLGDYPTRGESVGQAEAAIPYEHVRFGLTAKGHIGPHVTALSEVGLLSCHSNVQRAGHSSCYGKT